MSKVTPPGELEVIEQDVRLELRVILSQYLAQWSRPPGGFYMLFDELAEWIGPRYARLTFRGCKLRIDPNDQNKWLHQQGAVPPGEVPIYLDAADVGPEMRRGWKALDPDRLLARHLDPDSVR